jgi:hypothetical protein
MADPTPVFHATVVDGRLALDPAEAPARAAYLQRLNGKPVEVIVRRTRRTRSLDQNAYLWGVAYAVLGQALGYDTHERAMLHYALLGECYGCAWDQRFGREVPRVASSAMTTREFSDYVEWLVRWAAVEHGVVIPLPGESEAA